MQYAMKVRLSGEVMVTVEADSLEEARELAQESAEIGDVSSWQAEVIDGRPVCPLCGTPCSPEPSENGLIDTPAKGLVIVHKSCVDLHNLIVEMGVS